MEPVQALPKDAPGLMVCFLGLENREASHASYNEVGSENAPVRLEQLAGSMVTGSSPMKTRLVASQKGIDPRFRILMIPIKGGEQLPVISYDDKTATATVIWPGQKDFVHFSTGKDQRTTVTLERNKS